MDVNKNCIQPKKYPQSTTKLILIGLIPNAEIIPSTVALGDEEYALN